MLLSTLRFNRGVYLPDAAGLWLDPWDSQSLAFVSHAHSDHIGRHKEVILTPGTAKLMQARLPAGTGALARKEHILEFNVPNTTLLPGLEITLIPAGHIIGSAQSLIRTEKTNESLLYTGDFKLRAGLSAEAPQWAQADTLIMETTFGLPRFSFPPTEEVIAQIVRFCSEAIEDDVVPVLLGYSLGKGQEVLAALAQAGFECVLHGAVWKMTEVVRQLNPNFPHAARYQPNISLKGKVLICPPSANHSAMLKKIKRIRTAMLSGWAMFPHAIFRYQTDAAFVLSDHADYPDLIKYVELVQPKRILTLHGYAAEFARDLRERGYEAWALTDENQLDLQFGKNTNSSSLNLPIAIEKKEVLASGDEPVFEVDVNSMLAFAQTAEMITATTGKLKKIEYLSQYFQKVNITTLPHIARFFMGRPFAQNDLRVLNLGSAVIYRALMGVVGKTIDQAKLKELARQLGDLGEAAAHILPAEPKSEGGSYSCTILEIFSLYETLERTRGPLLKTSVLQSFLPKLRSREARYVIKILTGELRIGLREGLVEEAIAKAFDRSSEQVREAHMLTGDLGKVALLAKQDSLNQAELVLFQPIKCMLASPEPTADAIWKRHKELLESLENENSKIPIISTNVSTNIELSQKPLSDGIWVEDKFDGVRAQLHHSRVDGVSQRVEIFSRDLKQVTGQFDEIAREAGSQLKMSAVFDGEIIAYQEGGKRLTFFDLQKRLGRQESDLFLGETIPLRYIIFDLLWYEGRSLLREPLHERRKILESLSFSLPFQLVEVRRATSAVQIDELFDKARSRGNEGLITKEPESAYNPGRRGHAWLKLKKELATLDVVVVGAEWGHGKRRGVLSDYTFALRDPDNAGQLMTVGKAYSGLTDEEIADLSQHLLTTTTNVKGRYHEVQPEVILEIAFDSIQPSTRHSSGLALRFPRIKNIRKDKTIHEIDTVEYARSLVG